MAEEGRIKLPERSTRGKRMRAQLEEEENEADQEFWNQEFFAEDAGDADYQSEKEEEDVPDSDFFESESEPDEDEEVVAREPKKKTLRPPGAPPGGSRPRPPKPPAPKPKQAPAASASPSAAGPAGSDELPQSVIFEATYEAPSLRKSTRARVEEAAKEREQREQQAKATRRPTRPTEYRVLTQEELLAEAARTELDNLASLKQLLAQEEETKKKAHAKKQRFGGPLVRFRSRTIQLLVPPEVAAREKEWQEQSQQQQAQPQQQTQQQQTQQAQEPAPQQEAAAAADAASAAVKEAPAAAGATPAAAEDAGGATAAAAAAAGSGADAAGPAAAEAAPGVGADAAAAAAGAADAEGAAKGGADAATPMEVDPQPPQQAEQQQQQVQEPQKPPEQPPAEEQPSGPVLVRQSLDSLQCLGMKAPKWLLPQRAPPPANKPICPITGGTAHYRDPLTGHWYSDADAFRELRRRLGQPLPPLQPYRRAAASPAAELSALSRSAAAATAAAAAAAAGGGAEGTAPAAEGPAAAAAAAGGAEGAPSVAGGQQQGAGGLPPGQLQLQEYVEAYMQRQLAVAGAKGRKGQSYEQQAVPDEVAALVLQVSQAVHG